MKHTDHLLMNQSSDYFKHWLTRLGPDQVIDTLSDLIGNAAVLAVDVNGNIIFWSKGAEKLFGWSALLNISIQGLSSTSDADQPNNCSAPLLQNIIVPLTSTARTAALPIKSLSVSIT